jgi:hypothetical protein
MYQIESGGKRGRGGKRFVGSKIDQGMLVSVIKLRAADVPNRRRGEEKMKRRRE